MPKVPRAKFLRKDGLFCFISISKFGSFMNPFDMIISLPEFYFNTYVCYSLFFSPNDSPSKTMKNAFYLIQKAKWNNYDVMNWPA